CNRKTLAEFIQRAAGYSLTGLTVEQILFLLTGTGSNGKSTLIDVFVSILGESYAQQIKAEVLFESRHDNKDVHVADLEGIRFAAANESTKRRRLATALIKQATGGERLVGRRLYESPVRFIPQFKLWFSTNHEPRIDDTTESIWRRIRKIPFDAYFPIESADRYLSQKLYAEASGILNWLVEGCLAWQRDGLLPPTEIKTATEEYRQAEDLVGLFVHECCVVEKGTDESVGDLYDAYAEWCGKQGEEPESKREFGHALSEKGFLPDRTKLSRIRHGLRLKTYDEGDA